MIHRPRFLSYAQNREDVRLNRAFPNHRGFFIDVGAADPIELSVTKALSERGWRGINVEPQQYYFQRLVADRPQDINLNIGLSDHAGSFTLFESPTHRGFSTFDESITADWKAKGIESIKVTVPVLTLAEVCERHVTSTIDMLKIDVEGHERSVLLGADFQRYRPRVLVIEATAQNADTPTHAEWEDVVLRADYRFAVFDGLNRFYVRAEDSSLIEPLSLPPNVFDDYGPAHVWRYVSKLESENRELHEAVEHLRDRLNHAQMAALHSMMGKVKRLFRRAA